MSRFRAFRRISLARLVIVIAVALIAVGAFVLHIAVLSFLLRIVVVVGIVALLASYLWTYLRRSRKAN